MIICRMIKSHTHLEFWDVDGTILHESEENVAPFPLRIGEQIVFGDRPYQVAEIIDTNPRELDGTLYYRRFVRVR